MRKSYKPTMNDVAREAGVTQATVSNVINSTANVSSELAGRVNDAIKKLGYVPNLMAKGLKKNTSNIIGVVIPDIESGHYSVLVNYFAEAMREKGYRMVLCNTFYDQAIEKDSVEGLIQLNVAGIITTYVLFDTEVADLIARYRIPFVTVDGQMKSDQIEVPSVETDNLLGCDLIISHLHDYGVRNLTLVSEPISNKVLKLRLSGYRAAMEKYGISLFQEQLLIADHFYNKVDMGYNIAEQIIENGLPDAICATTDNVAIGIMKKLYEKNIRIPQDVLLAGFDDISLCQYVSPSLTSVAQPREQMARISTDILIKMISGKPVSHRHVLLKPTLSVRNSTQDPNHDRIALK